MLKNSRFTSVGIALIVTVSVWSMAATDALAQHGHDGQQHPIPLPPGMDASPFARPTPHGGQMSVAGPFRFEVVYRPGEIRVYLYDATNRPISARGMEGQVAMTVRGYEKVYRYGLTHFTFGAGSNTQDYSGLAVNLSRIKDGDMSVTLEMTNLPSQRQPQATFTQTFALSKIPVTLAALDESDRPRIERQKVCAVAGSPLGSMGTPVKVLVGDHPIYLCCKGCLEKVQQNPDAFLPKATPTQSVWTCPMHPQVKVAKQGKCPICGMNLIVAKSASGSHAEHATATQHSSAADNKITVSTATAADQVAIRAQRVCAVAGSQLGGMGTPVKVTRNGDTLFLCCKGCVGKVEKNPEQYFAKAAELRAGH